MDLRRTWCCHSLLLFGALQLAHSLGCPELLHTGSHIVINTLQCIVHCAFSICSALCMQYVHTGAIVGAHRHPKHWWLRSVLAECTNPHLLCCDLLPSSHDTDNVLDASFLGIFVGAEHAVQASTIYLFMKVS